MRAMLLPLLTLLACGGDDDDDLFDTFDTFGFDTGVLDTARLATGPLPSCARRRGGALITFDVEPCDARPSFVGSHLRSWIGDVGVGCSWAAGVTDVDDRR